MRWVVVTKGTTDPEFHNVSVKAMPHWSEHPVASDSMKASVTAIASLKACGLTGAHIAENFKRHQLMHLKARQHPTSMHWL